jgi:uncharacterized protein YgbK (DUF1537 family)
MEQNMTEPVVCSRDFLELLPPEWDEDLLPVIREKLSRSSYKIIILDDDPTGTQTVRDVPVLTHWTVQTLHEELLRSYPAFFILTNSRSLSESAACELAREIGRNLRQASAEAGVRTVLISRSDSTLRGHFPAEVDAMAEVTDRTNLPYLILPFFLEGGRYTFADCHYVLEGDRLVPAAQTPFARDAVFGFTHSNLKEWVEEKTAGRISAASVVSVSIDDIRRGGPGRVAAILDAVKPGTACIVNAASYRDMEVLVAALLQVEAEGREFLYRTAASFVRTRIGFDPFGGLLSRSELVNDNDLGGLFVVGSYVEKTSRQVKILLEQTDILAIEINVSALLDPAGRHAEIERAGRESSSALKQGRDVVLFTSRKLITGSGAVENLVIGQTVSAGLIEIVRNLSIQPRYLVAKGGITSSDIATRGLGVQRAMVIGQALPGVPAWRLGSETRYPGMSYIIFPGNVGDDEALVRIQRNLRKSQSD